MRRLLGVVDVPAFVDLVVTRHRIGSIVHAVLGQLPTKDLPPGLMEPLSQAARHNAVKALQAKRTHIMLARWFAEAGIDWLPFKGTTLALRYYPDASMRQVNDLDIWVPLGSLPQARAILAEHGFRALDVGIHGDLEARGARHAAYVRAYFHEEPHHCPDFGYLELHWRLADNPYQFRLTPERILVHADTMQVGGVGLRVMRDTDLLLYLCEHGARHGWSRLKWLADLPRVLADRTWDWQMLLDRAWVAGCYPSLIVGLALCQDLLGWLPPKELRSTITASRRARVVLRLTRQSMSSPLFAKSASFSQVAGLVLRELALSALLTNTLRSVVHQSQRYMLSPNDLHVVRIPDRWFGLYYLMRPLLVIARRASVVRNSAAPKT